MTPRTIDNLGVDVSTRYAEDLQLLDDQLIKEARAIPSQTGIDVSIPSFDSELNALVRSDTTQYVWANFFIPKRYLEQKGRLFTFLTIPSLGSEEKKEAQMQKILTKLQSLAEKRKKREGNSQEAWVEQREVEEEEKEKKALTALFETISLLDKFLIDIDSRRSQYQKG